MNGDASKFKRRKWNESQNEEIVAGYAANRAVGFGAGSAVDVGAGGAVDFGAGIVDAFGADKAVEIIPPLQSSRNLWASATVGKEPSLLASKKEKIFAEGKHDNDDGVLALISQSIRHNSEKMNMS